MNSIWMYLLVGLAVNIVVKIGLIVWAIVIDADVEKLDKLDEVMKGFKKKHRVLSVILGIPFISDIVFWPILPCGVYFIANYLIS